MGWEQVPIPDPVNGDNLTAAQAAERAAGVLRSVLVLCRMSRSLAGTLLYLARLAAAMTAIGAVDVGNFWGSDDAAEYNTPGDGAGYNFPGDRWDRTCGLNLDFLFFIIHYAFISGDLGMWLVLVPGTIFLNHGEFFACCVRRASTT